MIDSEPSGACGEQDEPGDRTARPESPPCSVILFDGACNLCNASVRFVIARDRAGCFLFASRQSAPGRDLLKRHGVDPDQNDTVVLIEDARVYLRSAAALRIARRLRWPWPLLFGLIVIPRFLRDWVYDRLAANRYRWFGQSDRCELPGDQASDRFLS